MDILKVMMLLLLSIVLSVTCFSLMQEQGNKYINKTEGLSINYRDTPPKSRNKNSPNIIQKEEVVFHPEMNDYDHLGDFILKATEDLIIHIKGAPKASNGSLWPMPNHHVRYDTLYVIRQNNFKIELSDGSSRCDIIEQSMKRAERNIFNVREGPIYMQNPAQAHLTKLIITVDTSCGEYPQMEMNEKYKIEVRDGTARIRAAEVWGALHGLETFAQMVHYRQNFGYAIYKQDVDDWPLFSHRGLLIDTSRHFITMDILLMNIDIMAANKLNVLHWHIVDDNSFPFESLVFPNLTLFGAYDENNIYTQKEIRGLLNYARLRGIRVIPEFDTPGHTYSWGYGVSHLLVQCQEGGVSTGNFGPINPSLKITYKFLRALFTEIILLFPDNSIHLGGDEVTYECWENNARINQFMVNNQLNDIKGLLQLYEQRLLLMIKKIGKKVKKVMRPIVWQEVVDDKALTDTNVIVEIWKTRNSDLAEFVETNSQFKMIYSSGWYLDHISYGADWVKYYNIDDIDILTKMSTTKSPNNNILGGEICMWTEFVDSMGITPRIWPRASAAAERLWTELSRPVNIIEVSSRLEDHRCRMLRREFPVGVLSGPGFCSNFRKNKITINTDGDVHIKTMSQTSNTSMLTNIYNILSVALLVVILVTFVHYNLNVRKLKSRHLAMLMGLSIFVIGYPLFVTFISY